MTPDIKQEKTVGEMFDDKLRELLGHDEASWPDLSRNEQEATEEACRWLIDTTANTEISTLKARVGELEEALKKIKAIAFNGTVDYIDFERFQGPYEEPDYKPEIPAWLSEIKVTANNALRANKTEKEQS